MKITYVTGNPAKLAGARQFLEPLGFTIDNIKMDCPELQANTLQEVAKFKGAYSCKKLKCNCLNNDSGLFIKSLNGFPGVYTAYVEESIGEDGILKLLEGITDREAYFEECLCYTETSGNQICFSGRVYGSIALEKSGTNGWSYDFIFIPKGESMTLANFSGEKLYSCWKTDAYEKLAQYLKNKQ